MKLNLILSTFIVAFGAIATPSAYAQPRRNQRVVIAARVSSWGPQQGAPGTLVTLRGTGFSHSTTILIGGQAVRPSKVAARVMSFRVPTRVGDGSIILRKAGSIDLKVGRFSVTTPPRIRSFSPTSGSSGSQIEIFGRNFTQDDQVMIGRQGVAVDNWSESSLVVTIPRGARSGYLSVINARNQGARSQQQFRVVAASPFIRDFSPTAGPSGTLVRVSGGNFDSRIQVSYGRIPMRLIASGSDWFEVRVPDSASRDQAISIRSRSGSARSTASFALALPPMLRSYSPRWGQPGASVTLSGRDFREGDRVFLSGIECQVEHLSSNQLTILIPNQARSGAFEIRRANQSVRSASSFEVANAPLISNVSASSGVPGTQVIISGQYLSRARLFLGNLEIRPQTASGSQLQFVIPPRARSGTFHVTTRGGLASWERTFEVWENSKIRSTSPSRGTIGSRVVISGTGLGSVTQVFLGNLEMPILSRTSSGQRLTVEVPQGAQSGILSWVTRVSSGAVTPTRWKFEVILVPTFRNFSPKQGAPGTAITIVGEGYGRSTVVRYGNARIRVLRWEPNALTVEIPRDARLGDILSVENDGGEARAQTPFSLLIAPSIASWTPRSGKPQSELSIRGTGFGQRATAKIGGVRAHVLRVGPQGRNMVLVVPDLKAGGYPIEVESDGLRSPAGRRFFIQDWAKVTTTSRNRVRVGEIIMLSGAGLQSARIYFGDIELPIVRKGSRGGKLWVQIAKGCRGTGPLSVVEENNQEISPFALTIDMPLPPQPIPGPVVRDRPRKAKPIHRRRRGVKVRVRRRRRH